MRELILSLLVLLIIVFSCPFRQHVPLFLLIVVAQALNLISMLNAFVQNLQNISLRN